MTSEQPTLSDLSVLLTQADEEFVNRLAERMQFGAEKYGPLQFLEIDTIEEAMLEILDLANYARMTYIKLWLLKRFVAQKVDANPASDMQGFISTKEML